MNIVKAKDALIFSWREMPNVCNVNWQISLVTKHLHGTKHWPEVPRRCVVHLYSSWCIEIKWLSEKVDDLGIKNFPRIHTCLFLLERAKMHLARNAQPPCANKGQCNAVKRTQWRGCSPRHGLRLSYIIMTGSPDSWWKFYWRGVIEIICWRCPCSCIVNFR